MKLFKDIVFIAFAALSVISLVKADSVCDLNTLIVEIKQDLADNGMLDCLRVIEPPHFVEETEDQKNLRLAAQWDTACAFEADTNWKDMLAKQFGITQLVDSIGDPVSKDFEDQADMCEIIRAATAKNVFQIKDLNMQNIPSQIINKIDCVGTIDRKGPRICAATGTSYFQKDSWSIFLVPSYLRFAGKPRFVRERENSKRDSPIKHPQDNLLKTLLRMGKNALLNNEKKIEDMINKELGSDDQEPEHQKEKSRIVHVHVKRTQVANIKNNGEFGPLQGGDLSFRLEDSRIIFGFYMLSFKLKQLGNLSSKLAFNGREIPESRQNIGLVHDGGLTGAFAEVYNPKGDNVDINVLYDASTDGDINSTAYDHNLSIGAVSMPVGNVFKHINANNLNFRKTDNWVTLMGFDLNINNSDKKDAYFMVFYNFGMKLSNKAVFSTRLNIDGKAIKETSCSTGPVEVVGNHGAFVTKLPTGNHAVKIDYKYDGDDDINIGDFTDPHYVQSMTGFKLPEGSIVNNYILDKSMALDTKGGFKSFGLQASLNTDKDKTVLIIYNVNLRTDNEYFSVRLRMGNKFNRKSILSMKDLTYGRGTGYIVRVLKKGQYSFDIDFKSDSKENFNPETADAQTVSMQIIEMD